MRVRPPVITTLLIVGATAALMFVRTRQRLKHDSTRASATQTGGPIADTTAAGSPNLPAPQGHEAPPVGDFVYLFDVSASTKNSSAQNAFDQGIALLQPM